jgi:hypothetical protein
MENDNITSSSTILIPQVIKSEKVKLSIPFEKIAEVDINEIDVMTQETFKNSIIERETEGCSFFLAFTKDTQRNIQKVNGTMFMRGFFKFNVNKSPTTRAKITKATIYEIKSLGDQVFNKFCDYGELRLNKDHYAKIINANDPDLDPKLRGEERFYMGSCLLQGFKVKDKTLIEPDAKKAIFWFEKSREDKYFGANFTLITLWGKRQYEKISAYDALNMCLEAANEVPESHSMACLIYDTVAGFYRIGCGTEKNEQEEKKWRDRAEDLKVKQFDLVPVDELIKEPVEKLAELPLKIIAKFPLQILAQMPIEVLIKLPASTLKKLPKEILDSLPSDIVPEIHAKKQKKEKDSAAVHDYD